MNVDYKLIGTRVQRQRKMKGLTQEMLAEKLNVSVGYVSQVERGFTKISLDLLAEIATNLECDISLLVTGSSVGAGYLDVEISDLFKQLTSNEKHLTFEFIKLLLEQKNHF